jgi:hypothetical protein
MLSTENWWTGEIDWSTPAGQLLQQFVGALPGDRPFRISVFGSAPLQLTVDRALLSGDVDIFSDQDEDLSELIASAGLDRTHGGLYLADIDVRRDIIAPAIAQRRLGYGEPPPDYKKALAE